jgi:hypothetical protein
MTQPFSVRIFLADGGLSSRVLWGSTTYPE